jgi:hypothetical protein
MAIGLQNLVSDNYECLCFCIVRLTTPRAFCSPTAFITTTLLSSHHSMNNNLASYLISLIVWELAGFVDKWNSSTKAIRYSTLFAFITQWAGRTRFDGKCCTIRPCV